MSRIGNIGDAAPGPSSAAFMRRRSGAASLRRWLAALPFVAVLAFTFDGTAPAEISQGDPVGVAQEQRWSQDNITALVELVAASAREGLDPTDYGLAGLRGALEGRVHGPQLDDMADRAALRLAHDYAVGRITNREALDWHIPNPVDEAALATGLEDALRRGGLREWLVGLLPASRQYRALKTAYATAPDAATRNLIRANLERWRWLPRELGNHYLYVNVPSYQLMVIEGGIETASFNVIVGAPRTPTPQLALMAQSVVANPSWTLPPSVLKEGGWKGRGYEVTRRADGSLMVRQPPGPRNALGRIKIDMPNAHAIYLHDTPNKAAFAKADRALSHGCVRVQNIKELAATLYDGVEIPEATSGDYETRVFQLQRSVPVYLVYFTAEVGPDSTVREIGDPYNRDAQLLELLGKIDQPEADGRRNPLIFDPDAAPATIRNDLSWACR